MTFGTSLVKIASDIQNSESVPPVKLCIVTMDKRKIVTPYRTEYSGRTKIIYSTWAKFCVLCGMCSLELSLGVTIIFRIGKTLVATCLCAICFRLNYGKMEEKWNSSKTIILCEKQNTLCGASLKSLKWIILPRNFKIVALEISSVNEDLERWKCTAVCLQQA